MYRGILDLVVLILGCKSNAPFSPEQGIPLRGGLDSAPAWSGMLLKGRVMQQSIWHLSSCTDQENINPSRTIVVVQGGRAVPRINLLRPKYQSWNQSQDVPFEDASFCVSGDTSLELLGIMRLLGAA
jgi:hypothetical protein